MQAGVMEDDVRTQVWNLLGVYPRNLVERRGEHPYPFLIHLTPLPRTALPPRAMRWSSWVSIFLNEGWGSTIPSPCPIATPSLR